MNADKKSEDHHNQIRGFKATISNPQTSDEAKQHARDMLKKLDPENADYGKEHEQKPDLEGKNPGNVAGGLKAAINNPHVSDEGKQHAQEKLDNL